VWFPVQLHGGDLNGGMAINHNMGPGGMLIASSAELAAGTEVTCSFVVPSSSKQQQIKGHVIRVEKNADDPDGMWPYRIALAFDEVEDDLVPLLEQAAARISVIP
jgi:hypothetical protein